jgi:hypothetical protein
VPFRQSRTSVAAASGLLPVRRTLVAPMLPEPMSRMSPLPARRVSSRPKGMEPEDVTERQSEKHLPGHGAVVANRYGGATCGCSRSAPQSRRGPQSTHPVLRFRGRRAVCARTDAKAAAKCADCLCRRQRRLPLRQTERSGSCGSEVPALLGRLVEEFRPRLVVIACNTASTIALDHARAGARSAHRGERCRQSSPRPKCRGAG